MFFGSDKKSVTIDALYTYAKQNQQTLLPTEEYDFWAGYEANYQKFDRYFFQKFRAFKVCQEYDSTATTSMMLTDWKQIVDAHLFVNGKRYSELYRVQVLSAEAYDVVNNYDVHEVYERDNTGTQSMNEGQRMDSNSYGATQETTQYGEAQRTEQYGARQDSNSTTLGAQQSSNTEQKSAFNSSSMSNISGGTINNGSRQDSASLTTGAHTDTHTDSTRTDYTLGNAHSDTLTKGQQLNQRTDNLKEESTMHRYGNIGVQTPADVIGGHIDLWEAFKFYEMIFDEIALKYLVIDVDFDFASSSASGGSDADLLAAIRALSAQLTAAQTSINGNVDAAESTITGAITTAKTAIQGDISAAQTSINSNVDAAETAIRGDISAAQTSINSNVDAAETAIRGDILEVTTNGY